MNRYSQTELYKYERRWLYGAVTFVVFASVAYVYFLCASVTHVVMRKELSHEIAALASDVSELESRYIEVQHTVSADVASREGYVLTSAKIFLKPAEPTVALSKANDS